MRTLRFWEKVDRNGPTMPGMESQCWVWTGTRLPRGYGTISVGGRLAYAHRVAFEIQGGVITMDKPHVLHRCDNPPCVRGDHLFAGTPRDNTQDMINKGRSRLTRSMPGESHPMHKLTADDVIAIRHIYGSGFGTTYELSEMFNVAPSEVSRIVSGKLWGGRASLTKPGGRHSIITEDDVRAIRASTVSSSVFAREFRVNKATIQRIRNRKSWAHVH